MITDISQLDPNGTYTCADYLKWQFEEWVELLGGRYSVFNRPGKSPDHQRSKQAIGLQIFEKLNHPDYEIWMTPLPVILGNSLTCTACDLVIPDVFVINKTTNWGDEAGWHGVPDWIIEITSPRTAKKNFNEKFNLYEESGVGECWIVQPKEQAVNVYVLEEGPYALVDVYESGEIPSRIFPDLFISHDCIFR